MISEAPDARSEVTDATFRVLVARCLLAELTRLAPVVADQTKNTRLVCSTSSAQLVGQAESSASPTGLSSPLQVDIMDASQCAELVRRLLSTIPAQPMHTRASLAAAVVKFYRVCSADISAQVTAPVHSQVLQHHLFNTSSRGAEAAFETAVSVLEALRRAEAFSSLVEFLLLDMHAHRDWRVDNRIVSIVQSLPAGSSWRRQVDYTTP